MLSGSKTNLPQKRMEGGRLATMVSMSVTAKKLMDECRLWPPQGLRGGGTSVALHAGQLYNLTDEAIRACPPSTEWVMATNGDNLYAETFLERVMAAPAEADVVAFLYFSRYQRCTGPPCHRFELDHSQHACKPNK